MRSKQPELLPSHVDKSMPLFHVYLLPSRTRRLPFCLEFQKHWIAIHYPSLATSRESLISELRYRGDPSHKRTHPGEGPLLQLRLMFHSLRQNHARHYGRRAPLMTCVVEVIDTKHRYRRWTLCPRSSYKTTPKVGSTGWIPIRLWPIELSIWIWKLMEG